METALDTELPLMTAEEFFDWATSPERNGHLYELENGKVIEMPPPGDTHGTLCSWIAYLLWQFAIRRGRGRVTSNDTGILVKRNPDTMRGADVMFFDENLSLNRISSRYSERTPALVVEVYSPNDRPGKLNKRVQQYLKAGVPLVWVVFPEDRTVNVYTAKESPRVFDETEELTGDSVLPDFRCKVSEFFTLPGSNDEPQTTNP